MAEYILPEFFEDSETGETAFSGSMKRLRTMGRRPSARMDASEHITRRRMSKSSWDQLNAISKGAYVNHLGRGHHRDSPQVSEREWELKYFKIDTCLGCVYTVHYYHTCDPHRAKREERIANVRNN